MVPLNSECSGKRISSWAPASQVEQAGASTPPFGPWTAGVVNAMLTGILCNGMAAIAVAFIAGGVSEAWPESDAAGEVQPDRAPRASKTRRMESRWLMGSTQALVDLMNSSRVAGAQAW